MSNRSLTKGSLDKDKQVRLTYDVPLSLRQEFKKKAIYDEKDMRQALMELMEGYVEGRFKLK